MAKVIGHNYPAAGTRSEPPAVIRVGPGADQGRIKQLWAALKLKLKRGAKP